MRVGRGQGKTTLAALFPNPHLAAPTAEAVVQLLPADGTVTVDFTLVQSVDLPLTKKGHILRPDQVIVSESAQNARLTRIRTIIAGTGGATAWATMADEAGYFDQAHMISDFRAFMGVPPAAFTAGRLPSPTPCADVARLGA